MVPDLAQGTLDLQVEQLVVEDVPVMQVFICPVPGFRNIDQAPVVEFPGAEQKTDPVQDRQHGIEKGLVAGSPPEFAATDHEPEFRIHPPGGSAITDATRSGIRRAESGTQAITLLLAAPEFQRR